MTVLVIARNTFREATRDRLVAGVIAAGVALIAATQILAPLALGEGRRLTVDMGLSGIALLAFLVVILVGTSLVAKELERRTIFNLLSRPISRHGYLVGKWVGLCAALWVVLAILGVVLVGLLALIGSGGNAPAVLVCVYLTALEITVMTALAVLFSAISTPVLSALYTLAVYAVGQWSYDLRAFVPRLPDTLQPVVGALANLVPNLPLFNARALAASGHVAGIDQVVFATLYAAVYAGCVLSLAAAAFESRDFK